MSRRLELEDMPRPFECVTKYIQKNYMAQIGQAGVCVFGAMVLLIEDGNFNPTYAELGSIAGCKEGSLRTALDLLAFFNIITKVTRFDKRGSKLSNLYKLNDPEMWSMVAPTHALIFDAGYTPVTFFDAGGDVLKNEASTSVSDVEVTPASIFDPASKIDALSSSSSSFLVVSSSLSKDLLTTDQKEEITNSTLPTFTNSGSRDPHAREESAPTPLPSMNDLPFQKIERMWQVNCGKVNQATEDALWAFYEKYGPEMLQEGLKQAITNNTRGDKPSMRFVEVICDRLQREKIADEARIKAIQYQANPQERPETGPVVYANKSLAMSRLYDEFKQVYPSSKPKEDNGNG